MRKTGLLIWYWILTISPFTAILTFVSTLIICSQVPNNAPVWKKFPQISQLGTGQAYYYFVAGFSILFPQLIIVLLGRIQILVQSQSIIPRIVIYIIHSTALFSGIFLLIMAIVSIDDDFDLHLLGAYGMFRFLSLYCSLNSMIIIYLFLRRLDAPQ